MRFAPSGLRLLALANVAFAADAPIKIKMIARWQAGTVPFKVFEQLAVDVKAKSQGRLIIKPLPAGSVVESAEALDAVTCAS